MNSLDFPSSRRVAELNTNSNNCVILRYVTTQCLLWIIEANKITDTIHVISFYVVPSLGIEPNPPGFQAGMLAMLVKPVTPARHYMVLREGVEPPTLGSSDQRSTTELPKHYLNWHLPPT